MFGDWLCRLFLVSGILKFNFCRWLCILICCNVSVVVVGFSGVLCIGSNVWVSLGVSCVWLMFMVYYGVCWCIWVFSLVVRLGVVGFVVLSIVCISELNDVFDGSVVSGDVRLVLELGVVMMVIFILFVWLLVVGLLVMVMVFEFCIRFEYEVCCYVVLIWWWKCWILKLGMGIGFLRELWVLMIDFLIDGLFVVFYCVNIV